MNNLLHSQQEDFPIVLSDGFIGIGKSEKFTENKPYFFACDFDYSQKKQNSYKLHFQPKHYFKYKKSKPEKEHQNSITSSSTSPETKELYDSINRFLKSKTRLQKVILAQKKIYKFKKNIDPQLILKKLIYSFPLENTFAIIFDKNTIFFGSSPECLYTRKGNKISIDCVAGTAMNGFERELFSQKNLDEHQFVTNFISKNLQKIASDINTDGLKTKKAGNLHHLHQQVHATLNDGISDFKIIDNIHPTPATLGYPREEAYCFLKENEKFQRGLYAGCVGWIGNESSKITVALRSGLVRKNKLTIFAGAGIIKESSAESEINEIKNKFKTLEEVFIE